MQTLYLSNLTDSITKIDKEFLDAIRDLKQLCSFFENNYILFE